jgi:glucokinase
MSDAVLAVDVGGTHLRAAIVEADGSVHERRAQPTPQDMSCPDALLALTAEVRASRRVSHAVIGLPGVVSYRDGCLHHAPNLPAGWAPHLNQAALEEHLGVPVELANDADAAAVGEALFGAGRGRHDVVYLTVSTGIGAGVVLGGRLVAGTRSLAEVGHTILDLHAHQQGRPSTLEDLGSGTALGRFAAAADLPSDGEQVLELVRAGDRQARRVWDGVVDAVAAGVHNLIHLFAPDVVVLGGGLGRTQDLLEPIRDAVHSQTGRGRTTLVEVVSATLGDDAGLVGAAGWHLAHPRTRTAPKEEQ